MMGGRHMSRIIGIDLGTTNSLAAYWENGGNAVVSEFSKGFVFEIREERGVD